MILISRNRGIGRSFLLLKQKRIEFPVVEVGTTLGVLLGVTFKFELISKLLGWVIPNKMGVKRLFRSPAINTVILSERNSAITFQSGLTHAPAGRRVGHAFDAKTPFMPSAQMKGH
jgi:hypothetical protein